jgi:uncharacterized protein (TIGR00255 family)
MTAYGRAQKITASGKWTVEIASVNRKGLDLNLALPRAMTFLDPALRKWVAEVASRGQLSLRIDFETTDAQATIDILKQQKNRWVKIAKALKLPESTVDLPFLVAQPDFDREDFDEKKSLADLYPVWRAACKVWIAMKEKEGMILVKEIQKRLELLKKSLKIIEKLQPQLQATYRKKLKKRMEELTLLMDENQLIREAALLAEKSDITEEITRLYSHEEQMQEYLASQELSVGRTLDFLAQEMGREISTLMAKAGNPEIAKIAVTIKSEVEKIREQVQNIE